MQDPWAQASVLPEKMEENKVVFVFEGLLFSPDWGTWYQKPGSKGTYWPTLPAQRHSFLQRESEV